MTGVIHVARRLRHTYKKPHNYSLSARMIALRFAGSAHHEAPGAVTEREHAHESTDVDNSA